MSFADVTSANVVGYLSKNIGQNDWRMIAASFEGVSGAAGIMKIADIKCDATPVTKANKDNGAQLMLQTATGGYTSFYYLSDAVDEVGLNAALEKNDEYQNALTKFEEAEEQENEEEMEYWDGEMTRIQEELLPTYQVTGWANFGGSLATKTIDLGLSYWYIDPSKADGLSSAGQVPAAPSIDIDMNVGWTMICNPYPTAANFSEVIWTDLVPVTKANKDNGAQLMIQTAAGGYTSFYYLSDAVDEDGLNVALAKNDEYQNALTKFEEAEEQEDEEGMEYWDGEMTRIQEELLPTYQVTGWANFGGSLKTGSIADAGLGFWLMLPAGSETVTATFAHP